jgi:hypothetical protein
VDRQGGRLVRMVSFPIRRAEVQVVLAAAVGTVSVQAGPGWSIDHRRPHQPGAVQRAHRRLRRGARDWDLQEALGISREPGPPGSLKPYDTAARSETIMRISLANWRALPTFSRDVADRCRHALSNAGSPDRRGWLARLARAPEDPSPFWACSVTPSLCLGRGNIAPSACASGPFRCYRWLANLVSPLGDRGRGSPKGHSEVGFRIVVMSPIVDAVGGAGMKANHGEILRMQVGVRAWAALSPLVRSGPGSPVVGRRRSRPLARWVTQCLVKASECATKKSRSGVPFPEVPADPAQLPLLPALVRAAEQQRKAAGHLLTTARDVPAGDLFTETRPRKPRFRQLAADAMPARHKRGLAEREPGSSHRHGVVLAFRHAPEPHDWENMTRKEASIWRMSYVAAPSERRAAGLAVL